MITKTGILGLLVLMIIASYNDEQRKLEIFSVYFSDSKEFPERKWNYTADTVKVWYDEKKGEAIKRIKGKPSLSGWKQWDKEMNSTSKYDSIWYDKRERAIKGYFYENNDFYKLIGKGPTKTLRTYWFDDKEKIHEILYYWIPEENTTTSEYLKPIVEWAKQIDSIEISKLYPNGQIIPSKDNAIQWKKLLHRYNNRHH